MRKTYLLIGLVFVFLISVNYVNATGNELLSQTSGANADWNSNTGYKYQAQTFNLSTIYNLTQVSIHLYDYNQAQTLTAYLYNTSSGAPSSSLITLGTYTLGGGIVDRGFINFTMSNSYTLTPGITYAIVLSSGTSTQGWAWFKNAGGNPYINGSEYITDTLGSWTNNANDDMQFILYGLAPSNSISLSSLSPLNLTYTYSNVPNFTFNVTSIVGNWNTTLWLNNSNSYGSNNSISSTGVYSITSSTIPAGEYLWWINATSGSLSQITEKRNIFINPGTSTASCVQTLTNAYFIPDGCTSST